MIDYLKITDNADEKIAIAHRLIEDVNKIQLIYTPLMKEKMYERIDHALPGVSQEEKDRILYLSIYDYWVYGIEIDEEFSLDLLDKTDAEKREYMVRRMRSVYVHHLNAAAGPDGKMQLEDKYRAYERLKPYYKRDVIEVRDMSDLDTFADFVSKHKEFVVKPADSSFAVGVHKDSMEHYGNDVAEALKSILSEGTAVKARRPSRMSKMVLEELIDQDESMACLHPASANGVRATAVRGKDGKIHIFHPWLKGAFGGVFIGTGISGGFAAEIDAETGVILTEARLKNGNNFLVHPDTGITIKGFQIPKWDELRALVDQLMEELPGYGYIGWDLVLTPDGWCVMEANYSGEFSFQWFNKRGYKKEFEELIGWKFDKEFWWKADDTFHVL